MSDLTKAFQSPGFPSNPLPFLEALKEGVKQKGTEWIQSDEAKALLYVVLGQSYGQLFLLDSLDEYTRLKEALG